MRELALKKIVARVADGAFKKNDMLVVDDNGQRVVYGEDHHKTWAGVPVERYTYRAKMDDPALFKNLRRMIATAQEEGYKRFAFYANGSVFHFHAFTVTTNSDEAKKSAGEMRQENVFSLYDNVNVVAL